MDRTTSENASVIEAGRRDEPDFERLLGHLRRAPALDVHGADLSEVLQQTLDSLHEPSHEKGVEQLRHYIYCTLDYAGISEAALKNNSQEIDSFTIKKFAEIWRRGASIEMFYTYRSLANDLMLDIIDKEKFDKSDQDAVISNPLVYEYKDDYVDFVSNLLGMSRRKAAAHFNALVADLSNTGDWLATEGYSAHKGTFKSASAFLEVAYGRRRLGVDGDLTQAALRRLDPKLMTALDNEFRGRRDELAAILPRKSAETDRRLREALGEIPSGKERANALGNLSKGYKPRPKKQ